VKRTLVLVAAAGLALSTAACGSSSSGSSAASSATTSTSAAAAPSDTMTPSTSASTSASSSASNAAMSAPVGPGCAAYAKAVPSGAGSVDGMAQDPVAVAASNNPLLKTLVAAASGKLNPKVNLVDTLNGGQFTVFAPVDAAFAKVPAATLAKLKTDSGLLTKILTYHVLPEQVSPDKIVGDQKTVEGSTVTVAGTPDNLTVNGAKVICGGVHTANATVYLIDGVLTPKS
jgi:uncharacterized surface protein with fasciclin (FAS1) repeats